MKKKIIITLSAVIIIAVLIGAYKSSQEKVVRVQTAKVFRDNITQTVTGNGRIYPVTEVKISARVQGKITEISVDEGDSVKVGQVLVRLERKQYLASLKRAQSSLLGARANLTLAGNELKRAKSLFRKKLTSKADLDVAQAKYDQALSTVQQMEASVSEAQDALDRTILSSPINGIVIQKNKEVGEIALGSQFQEDVILVVADLSNMEARVEVNENDIVNVALGDTTFIEIDAFPDSTFKGIVSEIANSAKTQSQGTVEEVTNFEVRIRLLDRLLSFRPGMSATADIATETHKNVLNLPIQSVTVREKSKLKRKSGLEKRLVKKEEESPKKNPGSKDNKKNKDMNEVVFVVNNGIAEMRPVKLGISDDSYYEVISGVKEGEEVVTGPFKLLSQNLKDGEKVKVDNKRRRRKK